MSLSVIIVSASSSRRMKSFGPRALITFKDGRTLIRRQIDVIQAVWPDAEIIVVLGFEAEKVIKTLPEGIRVIENENFETTGIARSISLGLRSTNSTRCLVVYGDILFNKETLEDFPEKGSVVLVDSKKRLADSEVGLTVANKRVTHFSYGLKTKWCSVFSLEGKELHLFKNIGSHKDKRKLTTQEILNEVIDRGGNFSAYESSKMKFVEIDIHRDIKKAELEFSEEV